MLQDKETNLWTKIEDLIDIICTCQTISRSLYTAVYIEIYNYLTEDLSVADAVGSKKAPDRVRRFYSHRRIAGGDVYHHIKFCLQDKLELIVQTAQDMLDDDALRLYEKHWNQYKSMCAQLNGSCAYLNRHWVQREYDSGRRDVYEIGLLSREIWERVFFEPLIPRVTDACCNIIKSQRNHQTIDNQLLKNIIQIFVNHDFNETVVKMTDNNLTSVNFCKENFESKLLRDAEDFYLHQMISYDETKSLITYLNQVTQYIDKEIEHVQSYLPESTKLLLIKTVEGKLIHDYRHVIHHEIKTLLDNDKHQDLTDLFKVISRMPNTKTILAEVVKNYIEQMGMSTINTIAIKESKVYIDTILDVYVKCLSLVKETFNSDSELIAAFNKACHYFINYNHMIESVNNTSKSPELLAQYCDTLLRKGGKIMTEIEFEEKCNQLMLVFNFIEDKDIYVKIYGKMLAKRLINQLSVSDDYEKLLVTKLKQLCGAEYTSKLERMIYDIDISQIINEEYQTDCKNRQEKFSVDFSIMILTSNSWSLSLPLNIILPNELNLVFNNFIQFYHQRYTGRKLTHFYQYSKGELQTYFIQQKYTLQVSMYQMIVLLLFNKSLKWTIEQIANETEIKIDLLIQILNNLIKSNLLLCTKLNNDELRENDLHMKHIIELTTDYKSEKTRINLNLPMKSIKDVNHLQRTIDDDRKLIIQAIIVRIMKEHKILKYSLLIQKVIEQLYSRFKPDVSMIKKCIDILIEKEYLQRQSNEKDVLEYLP